MYLKMLLAALIVQTAIPTLSQVAPETSGAGLPLTIGVGYSNYDTDWSGRLSGPTFWVDWNFYERPSFLHGFGIEVEARDLNYDRTGGDSNLRQDTAEGGVIYTWRHLRRVNPDVKFLAGYGNIDFNIHSPGYTHDSRSLYAPGGGADFRVYRNVWLRGNYEYQFWTDFFNHHALNPNGVTIGVAYDLRRFRRR